MASRTSLNRALLAAVEREDVEGVRASLAAGADVEARNELGDTALVQAAQSRRDDPAIVSLLLAAGADVDAVGLLDRTALEHACSRYDGRVAGRLLEASPRRRLDEALHLAALEGRNDHVVAALVERGASPRARLDGRTLLSLLAEKGYESTLRVLVGCGAAPDERDDDGRTPLVAALAAHGTTVAIALLELGATADLAAADGATPLELAAAAGREEVVAALLDHGADLARPGRGGTLPLVAAVAGGHLLVAELLLRHGAQPDLPDGSGLTPRGVAATRGNLMAFQLLLEAPPDPTPAEVELLRQQAAAAGGALPQVLEQAVAGAPRSEVRDVVLVVCGPLPLPADTQRRWQELLEKTASSPDVPSLILLGEILSALDGGARCRFEAATWGEAHAYGRTVDYTLSTTHLSLRRNFDEGLSESWQRVETLADEVVLTRPEGAPQLEWGGETAVGPGPMRVALKGVSGDLARACLGHARSLFRVVTHLGV